MSTKLVYRNYYRHCDTEWVDAWDSACDDECPVCGKPISPYKSEDLRCIEVEGVILDDWVENNDPDLSYGWSQVCDEHLLDFPDTMHDCNSGSGICGVKGCQNEADHYIDFDEDDTKPVLYISDE